MRCLLLLLLLFGDVATKRCSNSKVICRDKETCCHTKDGGSGCCEYADAVCCEDGIHCCPSGTQCDKGRCNKKDSDFRPMHERSLAVRIMETNEAVWLAIPWLRKPSRPSFGQVRMVKSLTSGGFEPNNRCPPGYSHCHSFCCPPHTQCNIVGCLPFRNPSRPSIGRIEMVDNEQGLSLDDVSPVLGWCPQGWHDCGTKCCPPSTHCTPQGCRFNRKRDFMSILRNDPASAYESDANDDTGRVTSEFSADVLVAPNECPPGWMQCFFLCCAPGMYCKGNTCQFPNKVGFKRYLEISVEEHSQSLEEIVCQGGKSKCPTGATCCPSGTPGLFNCCPAINAVCCNDQTHCCPAGHQCNGYFCVRHQLDFVPFLRKIPATALEMHSQDDRDDGNTDVINPGPVNYPDCPPGWIKCLAMCCPPGMYCKGHTCGFPGEGDRSFRMIQWTDTVVTSSSLDETKEDDDYV